MADAARRAALGRPDGVLQARTCCSRLIAEGAETSSSSTPPSTCTRRSTRCRERSSGTARSSRRVCSASFRSTVAGPDGDDLRAGRALRRLAGRGRTPPGRRGAASAGGPSGCTRSARHATRPRRRIPTTPRRALNRWLDLAPSVFADVAVLDDPGSALSHWNLHERTPRAAAATQSRWTAGPLRFAHFEGFDPGAAVPAEHPARTASAPAQCRRSPRCASRTAERLREAGWRDHAPARRRRAAAAERHHCSTTGSRTCSPTRRPRARSPATSSPSRAPSGSWTG